MKLALSILPDRLAVCRLEATEDLPRWALSSPFFALVRTPEELSVVCREDAVPLDIACEAGWRCFKIHGPLDFGATGILASLTQPLARAQISLFALSTYDTDYILVKEHALEAAKTALAATGHTIEEA